MQRDVEGRPQGEPGIVKVEVLHQRPAQVAHAHDDDLVVVSSAWGCGGSGTLPTWS